MPSGIPTPDPRIEAMAREWCRMLGRDPDAEVRGTPSREPRWVGYAENCRRLLRAADLVPTGEPIPVSDTPPSSSHFLRDEAETAAVVKRMAERERRLAWGVKAETYIRRLARAGVSGAEELIEELDQ